MNQLLSPDTLVYSTRSKRKVSTIGHGRFVITIPQPWIRAVENAFKQRVVSMTFEGYTDKAILRPVMGSTTPRVSIKAHSEFCKVHRLKNEIVVSGVPIAWLRQQGFDPLKHARSRYIEGYPMPRSFYVYISTNSNEICIEPRSEKERAEDEKKDEQKDAERVRKYKEKLQKLAIKEGLLDDEEEP